MDGRKRSNASLRTRVLLANAAVFVIVGVVLALTPITVRVPGSLREASVLAAGLGATALVNLFVVGRTFAPLSRLTEAMQEFDPLQSGYRVPFYGRELEILQLTTAFNDMLDRIEGERRESVQRSLAAQEGERKRVAQELHDEVGQSLTALLLQIESLARSASREDRGEVEELRQATRDTLHQVRDVARRLRPEVLDDIGLGKAISGLCGRLGEQSGLSIDCAIDSELPQLPPEAELVAYRVAQEALTNTLRHSGAEHARVRLERDDDVVMLTVDDDGRGMDHAEPGAGIQGMRERALLVGAELEIGSRPEGGSRVELRLDMNSLAASRRAEVLDAR